jgi:hypothetical protein
MLRCASNHTALGGQLTVRSSERAGTRFIISVPVHVHNLEGDSCSATAADTRVDGCHDGGVGSDGSGSGDDVAGSLPLVPTPVNTPASTPPLSRRSSESCLDEAARQALVDECFGADDGITGFFPPETPRCESLQQLKDKGKLPELLDLVRGIRASRACTRVLLIDGRVHSSF